MQKRHPLAVALLVFGLVSVAAAGGPVVPQAAKAAHEKYEAWLAESRTKLAKDVQAATGDYLKRLDEHIKAETAKGELDRVLELRAERERIEKDQPAGKEAAPRAVVALRAAYDAKTRAARAGFETAAKKAHMEFLAALDGVVKEETKAGRLDQALAVRNARKEFEKVTPTEGSPPPKATAQVPPKTEPNDTPKTRPAPKTVTPAPKTVTPPPMTVTPAPPTDPKRAAPAFDWDKAVASPARIQVLNIDPSVLDPKAEKARFSRVPDRFTKARAVIYGTPKDQYSGVADITVLADGYLFLACNYGYQGNSGGNWKEQRWTAEQFVQNGWRRLDEAEVGGVLVAPQNRDQVIFVKYVRKGEELRLRCNKYDPPFPIVFDAGEKK